MMQVAGVIAALMANGTVQFATLPQDPERPMPPSSQRTAADPFADLNPMSDNELLDARGGFTVNDQSVDIAGFLIEFSLAASQFSIIASGSDVGVPDIPASAVPEIEFDPGLSTVVINNTLDNVLISRDTTINVHIPNFNANASQATGISVFTSIANNAFLFPGLD